MLLFKKEFHEGLKSGAITLTFRQWGKPKVKPGGRYRCHPIGVLEVDDVRQVKVRGISDADARSAGFEGKVALVRYMSEFAKVTPESTVYRVKLHFGGDGDRVQLALEDQLTEEDVAALREKLRGMDERFDFPWTRKTLKLIAAHPRIAASKLAPKLKLETLPFKANVVKLKKLGLTQSFEVGYELSPRGRAFVERAKWKW